MFERTIQQAENGEDHFLTGRVRTVLDGIEEDRDGIDETIENELTDVEEEHPLLAAVRPLKRWIEDENYHDGAQPAIQHLEDAFEQGRENDNQNIAVFAAERLLRLRLSIGRDAGSTVEDIVDSLESEFDGEDIHLGNFHTLLDIVIEHAGDVDDELLKRCVSVCEDRREIQRSQSNYRGERDTLDQIIDLKQELDLEVDDEQELLIESYQAGINQWSNAQGKGAILKEALVSCSGFLNDEKEREWKRELRSANRTAIEEEFTNVSPPDEVEQEAVDEARENVDRIVEWFRSAAEDNPSTYVLYCLLRSDGYFPDWELVEEIESGAPLASILPRTMLNREGDPIETEESPLHGESERIPNAYVQQLQHWNRILGEALYQLTESRDISEVSFLHLLVLSDRLDPDNQLFLMDLIVAVFEERYSEAIHMGVSRMESVVTTLLEETGQSVTSVDGTDIQQAGLGGLLRTIEDTYSDNLGYCLRVQYTEKAGLNLRNRVSHGQILYGECHFLTAMQVLFDTFQLLVTVGDSEYTRAFGIPRFKLQK